MSTNRGFALAFAVVTLVVLAVVIMVNRSSKIDCNDPVTWSTESGVRACAINGGE